MDGHVFVIIAFFAFLLYYTIARYQEATDARFKKHND